MSELAISGHGMVLSWQPTPGGAWQEIGDLAGDITFNFTRNTFDATTHNVDIDSTVRGVLRRGVIQAKVNYVVADPSHNPETGLMAALFDNRTTGFKGESPDGSVYIVSGGVTNFSIAFPVDGILQADLEIAPSGLMKIDDVVVGG